MQFGLSYRFARRSDLRAGTEVVFDPEDLVSESQSATISASLGLSGSHSLGLSIPVIYLKRSGAMENSTGVTVGDLEVSPRMFFSPELFGKKSIVQVSVGASLPVGNSKLRGQDNQEELSSGTFDPVFSMAITSMLSHSTNIFVSSYSRLGLGTANGRQTGDLHSFSGGVTQKLSEGKVNLTLRSRWTYRAEDVIANKGVESKVRGGRWFSLTPGIAAPLGGSGESVVRGWLEFDIPVYQNVGGEQLTEKWSVAFGLNTSFALFGHSKPAGKHGGHLLKP